ncbi:hypothetical protein [Polymorphospora lycopeni]|uniref:Uncharacterized protein n=1 Tax=Polymorphospora lycopeni TaxID=3140240 RepID=A0ABV5D229_9ACTN
MSIHLPAPTYRPGGPDGKGWNRLSLNAHMGSHPGQCALRPRSYAALFDMRRDTRHASFGLYGHCTSDGKCGTCTVLTAKPRLLSSFTEQILVRELDRTPPAGWTTERRVELHVMNRPDRGFAETSYRWTWEEMAHLPGWRVGRQYRDEHSEGFWLHKVNPNRHDGLPDCTHGWLNRDHCRECRAELGQ